MSHHTQVWCDVGNFMTDSGTEDVCIKFWVTVATAFAAAEERVDAMSVRRCDEPAPCCTNAYSSFVTTTDRNTVWRQTSARP